MLHLQKQDEQNHDMKLTSLSRRLEISLENQAVYCYHLGVWQREFVAWECLWISAIFWWARITGMCPCQNMKSCSGTGKQLTDFCREFSSAGLQWLWLRSCSTAWHFGSKNLTPLQTKKKRKKREISSKENIEMCEMVELCGDTMQYRIYLHHWTLCQDLWHSWWSLDIPPCCKLHLPVSEIKKKLQMLCFHTRWQCCFSLPK